MSFLNPLASSKGAVEEEIVTVETISAALRNHKSSRKCAFFLRFSTSLLYFVSIRSVSPFMFCHSNERLLSLLPPDLVNNLDLAGQSLLHVAAEEKNIPFIQKWVSLDTSNINVQNKIGFTGLHGIFSHLSSF